MDMEFLMQYTVPVIVGICLCLGFVIKRSIGCIPNKYIPLIMAIVGLLVNVAMNKTITADIALSGLFSGLVSTGMYELFRNIIYRKENDV